MDSSVTESREIRERARPYSSASVHNHLANPYRRAATDFRRDVGINTTANSTVINNAAIMDDTRAMSASTTSAARHSTAEATREAKDGPGPLLEVLLPVTTHLRDREEGTRRLGLCIHAGRAGTAGARAVLVRLTDPQDPFFLFELELAESDYGDFKQRLELLVDFGGFPRFLVGMIQGIVDGTSPFHVSFVIHSNDASRGTLRIIETTEFKTVEHISLQFLRQGDVGQKMYLAERFQFFEQALLRTEAEGRQEGARASRMIDDLQSHNEELVEENRRMEEELRLAAAQSEKSKLTSISHLRDEHAKELAALRTSLEEKLRWAQDSASELQKGLMEDIRTKDASIQELRERHGAAESELTALRSRHRIAEDTLAAQETELKTLRETGTELMNFKMEATAVMSDNELNYVSLTERLRGTSAALTNKEKELQSLREQYHKQDGYIHILSEQCEQLTEQLRVNERGLEKAHHIIANQLRTIKNAKERYRIAADQLRNQDALLHERQTSLQRASDELKAATDKAAEQQRRSNELREQLQKTDHAREVLAAELKQSQTAMMHLQRSTSINGRHWGVLASSASPAMGSTTSTSYPGLSTSPSLTRAAGFSGVTTSISPPTDISHEFGRNAIYSSSLPAAGAAQGSALFTTAVHSGRAARSVSSERRSTSPLGVTEPKRMAPSASAAAVQEGGAPKRQPSLINSDKEGNLQQLSARSFFDSAAVAAAGPTSAYF